MTYTMTRTTKGRIIFLEQEMSEAYLTNFVLPTLLDNGWSASAVLASLESLGDVDPMSPIWRNPSIVRCMRERIEAIEAARKEAERLERIRRARFPTAEEMAEDRKAVEEVARVQAESRAYAQQRKANRRVDVSGNLMQGTWD